MILQLCVGKLRCEKPYGFFSKRKQHAWLEWRITSYWFYDRMFWMLRILLCSFNTTEIAFWCASLKNLLKQVFPGNRDLLHTRWRRQGECVQPEWFWKEVAYCGPHWCRQRSGNSIPWDSCWIQHSVWKSVKQSQSIKCYSKASVKTRENCPCFVYKNGQVLVKVSCSMVEQILENNNETFWVIFIHSVFIGRKCLRGCWKGRSDFIHLRKNQKRPIIGGLAGRVFRGLPRPTATYQGWQGHHVRL